MTEVYIVQMRGPEWADIKRVFSNEEDAQDYCTEMNKSKVHGDMFESLSTYQYVEMDVV